MTLVIGDEASAVAPASAYNGDLTISYGSTKLSLGTITEAAVAKRKTKIICTLGPRSWGEAEISGLLAAGMDAALVSLSVGSHSDLAGVFKRIKKASPSWCYSLRCIFFTLTLF
jgi:pyruvate kinase